MKKCYNLIWTMTIAFVMTGMLSSCVDEDVNQAMALSGQWRGDFGMYYYYEYGRKVYRFDSYDTDIVFYPDYDYATHGYGKQVDYYREGPYSYQYYYFDWSIRDGVIYLSYPYDKELDTSIYDYRMTSDLITGYFGNTNTRFTLYKLVDYYDWSSYNGNYSHGGFVSGWNWGNYGYYSKSRDGKTVPTDELEEGHVVGRGNRFLEND
ncbi:MAG: hypothetical protein NC206_05085 [Bacteroides sp.]|nr:hypothetical protein [Roseburia sp.]MCM1346439.1 hypothetical protein [Bacteroides sp.]MCM1421724.1 hypothetical protein [Bacteroides sp.]